MCKQGSNCVGSGEIDGVSDTAELSNMIVIRTWKGIDLFWERENEVKNETENFFEEGVVKIGWAVGKKREGYIILDGSKGDQ